MRVTRSCREYSRVRKHIAKTRLAIKALTILVVVFLAVSELALATDLDKIAFFDIKAQPLEKALLQFGAQAHVQMSVAMDSAIRRSKAPDLAGKYTGRQALTILLKGTNLVFAIKGDIVEVSKGPASVRQSKDPASSSTLQQGPPLAQNRKKKSDSGALQEVVVTGSRIATTSKYGPQDVQIYDREKIEQSGQISLSDFLSTLPSVSTTQPAFTAAYDTTVTLRGLPVGTTLVLLDGRRLQGSGSSLGLYFNLADIPLAAVQKIEIDENGSSAVYGSDAIAGVVNIILKTDLTGFTATARHGWAKDDETWNSSVTFGKQWSRGGLSVVADYETDSGLLNSDRLLSDSNDYTSYGGTNNNYPVCFPANVFSTTGAPLPGAPPGSEASYAAVTGPTTSGKPALSQFTYGVLNNCALESPLSIYPALRRGSLLFRGHLDLAPAIQLFTELMYTHISQSAAEGDNYLFGIPGYQEFTVSASNPFNPFGTTVGVAEQLQAVPTPLNGSTDFLRPLVGVRGAIATQWDWEVAAWQSTDWTKNTFSNVFPNQVAIQSELNSADPTRALNPFVRGPLGSAQQLLPLFNSENSESTGSDRSAEAWIRGPVMTLPAGDVSVVVGGDYVRSTLHANTNGGVGEFTSINSIYTYHRRYSAVFGEAKVPIIARKSRESPDIVDLTISGRHDQYNDFGGNTTEQFGLEMRPIASFLVRGTYGAAFAAPALADLYTPQVISPSAVITNPVSGAPEAVELITGGNPSLRPLTGRSHSVGIVYSSHVISGLSISATQWSVIENNVTEEFLPQEIVDNAAAFPGRIVTDAAGDIVRVNSTYANFGSINVAGLDYQVGYTHRIWRGMGSIDLDATDTYHYLESLVPGSVAIESVSSAQDDGNWAPRWKGTVGVGWAGKVSSMHIDGRYTGSYEDYDSTRVLGRVWLIDANVRWSLGRWLEFGARALKGAYVEVGGTNIFNRAPQFSNYDFGLIGYDAAEASILGRSLYVDVGADW